MGAEHDPLEDLLASIADDGRPDWDLAERAADPERRAEIESLRAVSRIADFSRSRQREEGGVPGREPERWGDLLLLERLSAGAHAEVHRAWDPRLEREVALKRLPAGDYDPSLLEEARSAARIRHPHVVVVHGVDRHDGQVGLWMEFVKGPTLEQEVRLRGPLEPGTVRRLGIEIGSALAAVHAAGLLHRDIKPANVIRDAEGRFVLADFGLGVREARAGASGRVSGTPMFMAPETLAGQPSSERSDLYALGMLLWFALTGRFPFAVETFDELAAAAREGPSPGLRDLRPDLSPGLAEIVERAIAPAAGARFPAVRPMVEALEAWNPGRAPRPTAKRAWIALGLVVLAGLVTLALLQGRRDERAAALQAPVAAPAAPAPAAVDYAVEATFVRRTGREALRLVPGDRVHPGDRLSLEIRATRPAWLYVLNEDERGERYLLFPQPRLGTQNPLAADSTFVLPGVVGGGEQAWTVTSAGGREHFLVVMSPEPVPEVEADLHRFAAPEPGRKVRYATVGEPAIERLRGVGGLEPLPRDAPRPPTTGAGAFDRFRALAGRETGIRGVWVRQVVFENPR